MRGKGVEKEETEGEKRWRHKRMKRGKRGAKEKEKVEDEVEVDKMEGKQLEME